MTTASLYWESGLAFIEVGKRWTSKAKWIYLIRLNMNGDPCRDKNAQEESIVIGKCGPTTRIISVKQKGQCLHEVLFKSPAFCEAEMLNMYEDVKEFEALKSKHFSNRDEL